MAFAGSKSSRVLLGPLSLSCSLRSVGFNLSTDTHDVTTLCDSAHVSIPTLTSGTASFDGPLDLDTTANLPFDILSDNWRSGELPCTYGPAGLAAGAAVILGSLIETDFTVQSSPSTSVDWSATGEVNGAVDVGRSIVDVGAVTIDGSSASLDGGASSANGGVAQLHVTAFTGFSSDDIIVEHSANDSTWATLATFTQVTGLTSQRVTVAAGTTVNRYLRVTHNVTGSGSITVQVSFARR